MHHSFERKGKTGSTADSDAWRGLLRPFPAAPSAKRMIRCEMPCIWAFFAAIHY